MGKTTKKEPSGGFKSLVPQISNKDKKSSRGIGSVEVFDLKICNIKPYTHQARKSFSEESMNGLLNSIKEVGLINPIQVAKLPERGFFAVVNGERRLKAAQKAGFVTIPCIVLEDNIQTELISVIDNLQRQDLHPVELALAFNSLVKHYGDKKPLAKKLGISYSTFVETENLTKLPEKIQEYLLNKGIKSRTIFRRLLKCENISCMEQVLKTNTKEVSKRTSSKVVEFLLSNGEIKINPSKKVTLSLQHIEEMMEELKKLKRELMLSLQGTE